MLLRSASIRRATLRRPSRVVWSPSCATERSLPGMPRRRGGTDRKCGGGSTALGGAVVRGADVRRWLRTPRARGMLLSAVWLLLALRGLDDVAIVHSDESREVGIVRDVVAGHWL